MSKDGMYLCAELGVNWDGKKELLNRMVGDCIDAGVDAIKLQMFDTDSVRDYPLELRQRLMPMILDEIDIIDIAERVHESKIDLIVTPFYLGAFKTLRELPIDGIKIRAKDWWKFEFHNATRDWDIPVYTSVPYTMGEIDWSGVPEEIRKDKGVSMLSRTRGKKRYRVYCIPKYPPATDELNLYMVTNFDGISLHSPDWCDHFAAACINIKKQYDNGEKRRFYIEVHYMPTVYTGEDIHPLWARGILGRESFIDGAVSLSQRDLESLVKACADLEEAIG